MYYVSPCPQCNTRLRFPINEGSIQVRCPNCGNSFVVDPDDVQMYDRGEFQMEGEGYAYGAQKSQTPFNANSFGNWWANTVVQRLQRFFNPVLKHIPKRHAAQSGDFSNLRFSLVVVIAIFVTMFAGRALCQPGDPPRPLSGLPVPDEYPLKENEEKGQTGKEKSPSTPAEKSVTVKKPKKKVFVEEFPEGENFFHEGAPALDKAN